MKKLIFVFGLLLTLFVPCIFASKVENKEEQKSQQLEIAEITKQLEDYFNSITTFESDFIQTDGYGRESSGHFYMKMPSMMKMDYIDPPTHVMIARANKIVHYDRELEEKDEIPINASPLSFLLKKDINLKRFKIKLLKNEEDILIIQLSRQNLESTVSLVFSKNPFLLREWFIIEDSRRPQNFTQVTLFNWKYGQPIDDAEFKKFSSHPSPKQIGKKTHNFAR